MSGEKKTVLYFAHQYLNRAGVEEHIRDLESVLSSDFDIYIAFPQNESVLLYHRGTEFSRYEVGEQIGLFAPPSRERFDEAIGQILKVTQPDVIHVQHFHLWPLNLLEWVTSQSCPSVITHHDYFAVTPFYTMQGTDQVDVALSADYSKRVFGSDLSAYLHKRFARIRSLFQKFDHHLAPSHYLKNFLERAFPISVSVLEHGIAPFRITSQASDKFRFIFIGSLIPQKGWEILVHAFSDLIVRYPQVELHLYGGQPSSGLKQDQVYFHGPYERADLPQLLSETDVGVIPSLFAETYCFTLSEFWMAGCPVAVSKIGALEERVEEGRNGKFFAPGDPDSLQKTLAWFIENQEWRSWKIPSPKTRQAMGIDYKSFYQGVLDETISSQP